MFPNEPLELGDDLSVAPERQVGFQRRSRAARRSVPASGGSRAARSPRRRDPRAAHRARGRQRRKSRARRSGAACSASSNSRSKRKRSSSSGATRMRYPDSRVMIVSPLPRCLRSCDTWYWRAFAAARGGRAPQSASISRSTDTTSFAFVNRTARASAASSRGAQSLARPRPPRAARES